MRSSGSTIRNDLHVQIDLTDAQPAIALRPVDARARDAAARERALAAYQASRRRRRSAGILDAAADAIMAAGGLALANVALRLNVGLPTGIAGIAIGIALLGLGASLAARHRGVRGGTDPATGAQPPRVIVLEEKAEAITLDLPTRTARTHAA